MKYVARINLKTGTQNRAGLINFCLNSESQNLAIGWSYIHDKKEIVDFSDYYESVKADSKKVNPVLNIFKNVEIGDLFWTRDLDGNYWICRAKGDAQIQRNSELDIGAFLPVEAYKVGLQVPGQIKATFNRANGGTAQRIHDSIIIEYSKAVFNNLSNKQYYQINILEGNILDNLPDFDLEELVISYIQIKYDYYVLSNSIAKKSTTIKIECEFHSRNPKEFKQAVVQVKGKKAQAINALDYEVFIRDGYEVFLYAPQVENADKIENLVIIKQDELLEFYEAYKEVLPHSITQWENLF